MPKNKIYRDEFLKTQPDVAKPKNKSSKTKNKSSRPPTKTKKLKRRPTATWRTSFRISKIRKRNKTYHPSRTTCPILYAQFKKTINTKKYQKTLPDIKHTVSTNQFISSTKIWMRNKRKNKKKRTIPSSTTKNHGKYWTAKNNDYENYFWHPPPSDDNHKWDKEDDNQRNHYNTKRSLPPKKYKYIEIQYNDACNQNLIYHGYGQRSDLCNKINVVPNPQNFVVPNPQNPRKTKKKGKKEKKQAKKLEKPSPEPTASITNFTLFDVIKVKLPELQIIGQPRKEPHSDNSKKKVVRPKTKPKENYCEQKNPLQKNLFFYVGDIKQRKKNNKALQATANKENGKAINTQPKNQGRKKEGKKKDKKNENHTNNQGGYVSKNALQGNKRSGYGKKKSLQTPKTGEGLCYYLDLPSTSSGVF